MLSNMISNFFFTVLRKSQKRPINQMSTVDLFNLFDVDKSGGITSDEIQKGFSKIGFFYSPEKIKAFINTVSYQSTLFHNPRLNPKSSF